jgi:acetate kinase
MHVLALNSGSSSLKFGLYRVAAGRVEVLLSRTLAGGEADETLPQVLRLLMSSKLPTPDAVAHRIVHGGPCMRAHGVIDAAVLQQLQAAAAFAPLHMPAALALIAAAQAHWPGVPQLACLDTVFHAGLPDVARVLPLPRELQTHGLQRYGFHGLSLESIVRQLGADLPPRLAVAHLGSGCSVTAVQAGRSVDTSMGLTPTGGVMMGTRSGDIDPGVLLYLMREKQFTAEQLQDLLNHRSGLLGVSGVASDMRRLHEAAASNADAALAIRMFCQAVRKQIAAMAAVLGGLDGLVFTGGLGENDAAVRAAICHGLAWLGVELDAARNGAGQGALHTAASRCSVQVISSQENEQMARHAAELLAAA